MVDKEVQIREMSPEETPQLADLLASSLLGEHSKSKAILKLLGKRNSVLWMVCLAMLVYCLTGCLPLAFVVPPVVVISGILRSLATWSCTAQDVFRTSGVFIHWPRSTCTSSCGSTDRRTWVAVCGSTVVGSVTLTRHSDSVAELSRMRVRREHQGRGIGRRLVEHLEDYCRSDGIKQIVLTTSEYQQSGIRLYQRCGYIRNKTGDYSKALFPGVGPPAMNVSVQVYSFRKELML
ncbi:Hypp4153 [Branchiostoma lanceolatum]|uniref:Hypp4153 protein n=1 Tax=Branchiostoma lanceolatum TaxID=7740 RepID=A0A8K0A4Y0_BRALA|nr:Hypp4153 [Branchiostoma lanceolatum]